MVQLVQDTGPVVADIVQKMGSLTIGILALPFEAEGKVRGRNAEAGLKEFRKVLDSMVVIPDDKLMEIAPHLSIVEAFHLADRLLADSIRGITELVSRPGLINLDFAVIKAVLENGGVTMLGFGESSGENRAIETASQALESPLLEVNTSKVEKALVNIVGSPDISLEEAETAAQRISKALASGAQVNWGAQINEKLKRTMKVVIIVPDVKSAWAQGVGEKRKREEVDKILKGLRYLS